MKNNYLFCCLLAALSCLPPFLTAQPQCPITVDAGEDIYVCDLPTETQLHATITGDYFKFAWTPTDMDQSTVLDPIVSVSQPKQYVLTAWHLDESTNLVVNGDFEQGNTGFLSQFSYSPGNLVPLKTYDVLPNPESANDAFPPCDDHTSGNGNMLAGNAPFTTNFVWTQSVAVTPHTDYILSFWATMLMGTPRRIYLNYGMGTGLEIIPPSTPCVWEKAEAYISSGNLSSLPLTVLIPKSHPGSAEFGFAIDDIVLNPICRVSDTVKIKTVNVVAKVPTTPYTIPCEGNNITLNGSGSSVGPGFVYNWDTPDGNIVSGHNTLYPVVNTPGTYTLTVSFDDAVGGACIQTATVNVEIADELVATITAPETINCGNPNTLLTVQTNYPSLSTYQWTAGPGGHIVSANNTIAIINQPGDYTVLVTNTLTGCTAEASVSVAPPDVPAVNIQSPGILGQGTDTLTLSATANPPNATLTWTTPDGNIASGASTLNPSITAPGTYILTALHPTNGCKAVDTVLVAKAAQCGLTIDAGEDIYLCAPPQQTQLNVEIPNEYLFLDAIWTPASGLSDPHSLTPTVNVTQTKSYVVTVRAIDESVNLITNGDFEQGNTGFSSDLTYSPGDLYDPATYDVLPNPQDANSGFSPCIDHTTGDGNMFAANTPTGTINMWCQTVPITPNTDYYYSFWMMRLTTGKGQLALHLNDDSFWTSLGAGSKCTWIKIGGIWNSGNSTSVSICIDKISATAHPVAIDDIFLSPVCEAKDTVTVYVDNVQAVAAPSFYTIPCEGVAITLNGAGSSVGPNFTYQWDTPDGNIVSGQNTLFPVVNASGTYTLSVFVENGLGDCLKTATVQVELVPPEVWITGPQTLNCYFSNIILTGNIEPPVSSTYQWTASNGGNIVSGATNSIATVNQPGEYTLLVTNIATGCTAEASMSVAPPALPVANATASTINCTQSQATLSGAGSSTGPAITYAWSTAGGNLVSGQDSIYAVADTVGTYVLLVTNTANGCSKTDTIIVNNQVSALPVSIQPADTITCVLNNITLVTDSATAGAHRTYLWTALAGGNIVSGGDSLSPVVNTPGLYILQVTDTLNACKGVDSVMVVADNNAIIAIANAPDALTCVVSNVTLNSDGSSAGSSLTYLWSTSDGNIVSGGDSPTPIVNEPGIYQLLLTNPVNGCTATDLAEVIADVAIPNIALSVSGVLNCHNASVNLTNSGTGDPAVLNHQWTLPDGSGVNTGSSPVLNTSEGGDYLLLVSNTQNGCTSTATTTIGQHDNVVVTLATQQNATCFGAADGTATITTIGGDGVYTYLWSNDATTSTIGNLNAGTYTVTVTDGENCTSTASVTIVQPAELMANASATPISVIGASDGTATANPQGGISPYDYLWDNGQTSQMLTGLVAGFYTVTVTDFNGCTAVQTVQVWDGQCNLLTDFQTVNPLCNGTATGQATALPAGGAAPFIYVWTSGSTEQTATNLAAGTHAVTVTDVNGCAVSGEVTLGDPPLLTIAVQNVTNATCANSPDGSATVTAAGGTGNINITWSNGKSGPTATNLVAGDHTATATDANGCTVTTTANIEAIDQESPVIMAGPVSVPLGPSGAVELTLQNLGASVTDNCSVATIQITPDEFDCFALGEQQVIITAQDDSGNSSTQTITVTFVDNQAPVLECPGNTTRCNDDNTVVYAAPVAIDNCLALGGTFSLVSGLPSGSPFPQGVTTNAYSYMDMSGNTGTCSFEVTVLSPLVVNLDAVIHDIDDQHIGGIQVTVGGSMPGYTYEWLQNGQVIATTEDLSGIGTGIYTLLVTDASGCKTEAGPYEVTSLVQTSDPEWADYIAVYPNPSSGRVFAVLPDELLDTEVDFAVFDGAGRRVLEQQSRLKKQVMLDLSGFDDGLYSILIRAEQGQALRKIVLNR